MEPEFMSPHQIKPSSTPRKFEQPGIDVSEYDHPLKRDDLLNLLSVDVIEFELMLANEMLRPSLSMEYHEGCFLGFFTYWDCVAARISWELVAHGRSAEQAIELTEDIIPHLGEALRQMVYPFPVEAAAVLEYLSSLMDAFDGPLPRKDRFGCEGDVLYELAASISEMEEKFRIMTVGERQIEIMPFAIHLTSQAY